MTGHPSIPTRSTPADRAQATSPAQPSEVLSKLRCATARPAQSAKQAARVSLWELMPITAIMFVLSADVRFMAESDQRCAHMRRATHKTRVFTLLSSNIARPAHRQGGTHLESHHHSGARNAGPSPPVLPPRNNDTHVTPIEIVESLGRFKPSMQSGGRPPLRRGGRRRSRWR